MKIFKYLIIRIIILMVAITIFWNGAYYILPKEIQEGKFSSISEGVAFLRLSLIFVLLFLAVCIYEINKFQKSKQLNLRNSAIVFSGMLLLILVPLVVYNIKY